MKRPLVWVCLLFVLFIRLFYVCFPATLPDYESFDGREVYIKGQVVSIQKQIFEGYSQYTLSDVEMQKSSAVSYLSYDSDKSNSVLNTNEKIPYKEKFIYCYVKETDIDVDIGSYVLCKGTIAVYEKAQNPGQFDSRFYYHVQGVGLRIKDAALLWCDQNEHIIKSVLYDVKQLCLEKLGTCFGERYAGVMQTILLGEKKNLDTQLKQFFQEGGILHILTISGMHISMIGMGVFRLLRKVGVHKKTSAVIGMIVILLYGTMIGVKAAMFRAICMFMLQMAAKLLGRTYDSLTGLSVAALLLLLEEPMYLFYSGFLLSFGAVIGVCAVSPILEKWCKEGGAVLQLLAKVFASQLGILLITFPIQLYYFYEYALYSTWINLILLPFLPYIAGLGIAVLFLPRSIVFVFVWICETILQGYEYVCVQSQKLAFHSLVLGAPTKEQMIVYYACLAVFLWALQRKKSRSMFTAVCGISFVGAFFILSSVRPISGLCCDFLSVGQGDCAVFRCQQGTYVIDCGSSDKDLVGTDILLPYLKYYGISNVDGVFLSHADADHMNGILQWLEAYEHSHVKIGCIIVPELSKEKLLEEFFEVITLADTWQIPVVSLAAGDSLSMGTLQIQVLHPQKSCSETEDRNAYSQVLLFAYEKQKILMTGDIGSEQEAKISQENEQQLSDITILKAAHHGSAYSSSDSFLQLCNPKNIILSYGIGNRYGHPAKEAIERMQKTDAVLWYTGRQGAIQCRITKNKMQITSWSER